MGLPRATAFRFGQSHFEAVFNFYFNSRRDQKRARQIHALERVAILFLVLRHDARNAPSCFNRSPGNHETTKDRKDDTNIHVLNWGGPPLGVKILYTFPTPKMGIKQIEQFSDIILRILRFLAESSGVTKLKLFQPFPHSK